MAGREVVIKVWLTEGDDAIIRERIAEMNAYLGRTGGEALWDEERELASLVLLGLAEHRERQRRAAETERELRAAGLDDPDVQALLIEPVPVPEWLR